MSTSTPTTTPSARLAPYDTILPYERISFPTADGTLLRGNFYTSPSALKPAPIVIFIHGLGLLKEQYLPNWIGPILAAGYHALSYDHRSFGDSEGEPRETFDWVGQAEDFVDAVSYVQTRKEVDGERVFGWGVAHAGGVLAIAAAMDTRLAGIILFLPCMDGAYDAQLWGPDLSTKVLHNRHQPGPDATAETIRFWPLTDADADAAGTNLNECVLSGTYVRDWSVVAAQMAAQGNGNKGRPFSGRVTLRSFWNDFNMRPADFLGRVKAPLLWVMCTEDIVCGPLEVTRGVFDKLDGMQKEICVLEGEHLPQYFDPGFGVGVEAMVGFLGRRCK